MRPFRPFGAIDGKPIPDHVFAGSIAEVKQALAKKQGKSPDSITEAEARTSLLEAICQPSQTKQL
jgi:hypothetical protein